MTCTSRASRFDISDAGQQLVSKTHVPIVKKEFSNITYYFRDHIYSFLSIVLITYYSLNIIVGPIMLEILHCQLRSKCKLCNTCVDFTKVLLLRSL